jgi:hypothetical protein
MVKVRAVGDGKNMVFPVLVLELAELALQAEPVVPALHVPENLAGPFEERAEVRIGQPFAAADEQQSLERPGAAENRLREVVLADAVVGLAVQDHRVEGRPVSMEMDDSLLLSLDRPDRPVSVQPGRGPPAGDLFQEIVVVRRRDRETEIPDGLQDVALLRVKLADRIPEPDPDLALIRIAELPADLTGGGEEAVQASGIDVGPESIRLGVRQTPEGLAAFDAVLEETPPGGDGFIRLAAGGRERHAGPDHDQNVAVSNLLPQIVHRVVGHSREF